MSTTAQQLAEQKTEAAVLPVALPSASVKKHSLTGDYFQLFKVRVTSLIVMTAWTGYYMGAAKSGVPAPTWKLFEALVFFAIVFFWQFPHFQAIAWMYRDEYQAAGIKMLPVVDASGKAVIRQMTSYAFALLTISLLPALLQMAGAIYVGGALVIGLLFLGVVLRLAATKLPTTSPDSRKFARQLLQASVLYLPILFALMMIDAVRF